MIIFLYISDILILSYVLYDLYHNNLMIQTWLELDEYTTSTKLRKFVTEL